MKPGTLKGNTTSHQYRLHGRNKESTHSADMRDPLLQVNQCDVRIGRWYWGREHHNRAREEREKEESDARHGVVRLRVEVGGCGDWWA